MSEKKVVRRNVAIALGIACIILIAGLGGAMAYYSMVVNDKNTTYGSYVSSHAHTNSEYDGYVSSHSHSNSDYDSLQNQVNDLTSNLRLEKSEVWVTSQTVSQTAGSYSSWTHSANYAGYVAVQVESSTTDKTYIRFLWNTPGIDYDKTILVGVSGSGAFPVLPYSNLEVRVGNSNSLWFGVGATETVTITYYY